MLKTRLLSSAILLSAVWALPAAAQDATNPSTDEKSEPADAFGDIVVTAQRREERLQDLPIAATALSSEDLRKAGVRQFSDLQNLTPSLSIVDSPAGRFVNIRGVGLGVGSPQQSAGVPIHFDGMFIPREFALNDAYLDLERVEVLRGPQGTFVGQNSTGGAVFLVPQKPNFGGVGGYVQARVGDYNWYQVEGALNVPLSDTVAARIATNFERRDSFTKNLGPHGDGEAGTPQPGNIDRQSIRAQVLFEPSDSFKLRVLGNWIDENGDGTPNLRGTPAAYDHPRVISYDFPTSARLRIYRLIGNMDWNFLDGVNLHALAGYQSLRNETRSDLDNTTPYIGVPVPQSAGIARFVQETFNAEVTFTSDTDSPLQWVAGASYLNDYHPFVSNTLNYSMDYNKPTGGSIFSYNTQRISKAIFGEITYQATEQLELIVGGRFTWDTARLNSGSMFQPRIPTGALITIPVTAPAAKYAEPTGRIGLNYKINPDSMVYVTISRGYKPGGFTTTLVNAADQTPYDPEIVNNYEAGLKSTLAGGLVRTNLSAFYTDYRDYQASFNVPGLAIPQSKNIPRSKLYGAEAQVQFRMAGVSLNLNGAYLYSELGAASVPITIPAQIFGVGNPATATPVPGTFIEGFQLNYAPKWTFNAQLEYAIPVGEGTITPRVQYSYIGAQWAEFYHADLDRIPARNLVDLRVTWEPNDVAFVEGYITNLFDKLYINGSSAGNSQQPYIPGISFGAPRQVGVRVGYNF